MLGVPIGGNAHFRFGVGGNANFSVFSYQHVGIPNAKLLNFGFCPTGWPNASVFASEWNIGLNIDTDRFMEIGIDMAADKSCDITYQFHLDGHKYVSNHSSKERQTTLITGPHETC